MERRFGRVAKTRSRGDYNYLRVLGRCTRTGITNMKDYGKVQSMASRKCGEVLLLASRVRMHSKTRGSEGDAVLFSKTETSLTYFG